MNPSIVHLRVRIQMMIMAVFSSAICGCAFPKPIIYENSYLREKYEHEFEQRDLAAIEGFWRSENEYCEGIGVCYHTDASTNSGFEFACRTISVRQKVALSYKWDLDAVGARYNRTRNPNEYVGQVLLLRGNQQYWVDANLVLLTPTTAQLTAHSSQPILGGNTQRGYLVGPKKILEARLRAASSASSRPAESDEKTSYGSGFLVTMTAVVTNQHVVAGSKEIHCLIDGKSYSAKVIAQDSDNDLAVLRIEDGDSLGPAFPIADSPTVRKGQRVYAMGFPLPNVLGSELRVHEGIISSLSGFQSRSTQFQLEMNVHPGNSGGPLLREDGAVIGVITAKLGVGYMLRSGDVPQGITFAVKSDLLRSLISTAEIQNEVSYSNQMNPTVSLEALSERFRKSVVKIEASN